jgi:NADPH:quinone reductase-like Zn-dependent oxidoreductase
VRAVVQERYGPPDVLRIAEVTRPTTRDDEVLVRVHATTVTRGDTELRSNAYPFLRPFTGLRRPRQVIPGTEFSGVVESAGAAVDALRPGDEVFGVKSGANAEYVSVRANGLVAPKPVGLTFEEAAAIPDGSLLALTMLRPSAPLDGKHVLVYGAAGSIGTAAVQVLVHHFRAEVTAVCDGRDAALVESLGAARVVDRQSEDFTKNGETYDVIFDAVGRHSFRRCRRSLKTGGAYISAGSPGLGFVSLPLLSLVTRVAGSKRARLGIGRYRRDDLLLVKELVEAGEYRPVIGGSYGLERVVEANRYVETGEKTGSVVLRLSG